MGICLSWVSNREGFGTLRRRGLCSCLLTPLPLLAQETCLHCHLLHEESLPWLTALLTRQRGLWGRRWEESESRQQKRTFSPQVKYLVKLGQIKIKHHQQAKALPVAAIFPWQPSSPLQCLSTPCCSLPWASQRVGKQSCDLHGGGKKNIKKKKK